MKILLSTGAIGLVLAACTPTQNCTGLAQVQSELEAQGLVLDRDAIGYEKFGTQDTPTPQSQCRGRTVATSTSEVPHPPNVPDGPENDPESPERAKGNNGWGNGDQAAPGRSRDRNTAENSDRTHRNHGQGRRD